MSSSRDDTRVVVAIDFGTTFSGYAYANKVNRELITIEDQWRGPVGHVGHKTPTVIKYQDGIVKNWGWSALPKKRDNTDQFKIAKLFKLFLLRESSMKLPELPVGYKKAITDYLEKLGEMIKEKLSGTWDNLNFYSQVLIVLTVPTNFDDDEIEIMRDCAFNAKLLKKKDSRHLIFITEPEAAAIHCLNSSDKIQKLNIGDSFMVVDCGGGTVDLTCHELLANNRISEITESTGGNCGSSFVDEKFEEFLRHKLGESTFELLEEKYNNSLQCMVQDFSRQVKIPFTGEKSDFQTYEVDLEEYPLEGRSTLKSIIKGGEEKEILEDADWLINVEFDDVKEMFDPIIDKIIHLIRGQLTQLQNKNNKCSAMMLVGGFNESKYLQNRIRKEFGKIVSNISAPPQPIISVLKGGVQFGLEVETVVNRVLRRTYGTNVIRKSVPGDPPSLMLPNGFTIIFEKLAVRGEKISVNEKVVKQFKTSSSAQSSVNFNIYVTKKSDAKFCNEPEISLLRQLEVELPENDDDDDDYDDMIISLTLTFGTVEIIATAENPKTGVKYRINQKKRRVKLEYE